MTPVETLLKADRERLDRARGLAVPVEGLESVVAGALAALPQGAWWVPGPREAVGAVLRGVNEARLPDAHHGVRPYKVAPVSHAPALRALHAVGLAHGSEGPALVHLGVGSISDGAFTEALNLAALLQARVIFLVAAWPLTDQAPVGPQSAAGAQALADAHGVPLYAADGHDPQGVEVAVQAALEAGGPVLVLASL